MQKEKDKDTPKEGENLVGVFDAEASKKKIKTVKMEETVIADDSHIINLILGPCVSVIFAGQDKSGKVWFGINHMIRSRNEKVDVALKEVSALRTGLQEKGCTQIACLGLFGGSYRQESVVKPVARKNVETILEALSLFDFSIEIFETGIAQNISALKSVARKSFLIRRVNVEKKDADITEIPLSKVFK